jgi:hypothetical protein
MLSTKLHHFAFVAFVVIPPPPLPTRQLDPARGGWAASNYQRKGLPKSWIAGCVKDGQEPFDSCTIVMLSCPAPIRRL